LQASSKKNLPNTEFLLPNICLYEFYTLSLQSDFDKKLLKFDEFMFSYSIKNDFLQLLSLLSISKMKDAMACASSAKCEKTLRGGVI
jgi:hypothetical protein